MLKVTVQNAEGEESPVHHLDASQPIKVGSGEDSDLLLDHVSVGPVHALFAKQGDEIGVVHLGAPTGTFLNGKSCGQAQWVKLESGDGVRFGEVSVKIEFSGLTVSVVRELDIDSTLAKEFLYLGSSLTRLAYEETLFQRVWSGKQQTAVLRIKRSSLPRYERWLVKYGLKGLVAPEDPGETIDLLIYKEDRVRELIENWEKIRDIGNLTSAWFMAMLFQWPEKFIDEILREAQARK